MRDLPLAEKPPAMEPNPVGIFYTSWTYLLLKYCDKFNMDNSRGINKNESSPNFSVNSDKSPIVG